MTQNKITFFSALVVICASFTPLFAQQSDATSTQILNKLSAQIKNSGSLDAAFTLIIKMPNGKIKESKAGKLSSFDKMFKVSLGDNLIICNGKTIWNYNKVNKEVQINDYDAEETAVSPQKLFSNSFVKDFNCTYCGLRVMNGTPYHCIKMSPKDSKSQFKQLVIYINKSTNMIYSGYLTDKNGNKYQYVLSSIKLKTAAKHTDFEFKKEEFGQITEVDLR